MKHILIINGHPRKDSFNSALAETYKTSAEKMGASVKIINVKDLKSWAYKDNKYKSGLIEAIKA